jgi:hypothetical protein
MGAMRAKRLTRTTVVVLTGLVVVGLTGCGVGADAVTPAQAPTVSSSSTTGASPTQSPPGSPSPTTDASQTRLTTTVRYADAGILLEPPPADATPVTTSQQALAACVSGHIACGSRAIPSVQLALVTLTNSGTAGPDGTLVPLATRQLVWVLTWTGLTCIPAGPPGAPSTGASSCTAMTFIDAKTGGELFTESGPHL